MVQSSDLSSASIDELFLESALVFLQRVRLVPAIVGAGLILVLTGLVLSIYLLVMVMAWKWGDAC